MIDEKQYRLLGYQSIILEAMEWALNTPSALVEDTLKSQTLTFAQKCLALENADLTESAPDGGDHGRKPF